MATEPERPMKILAAMSGGVDSSVAAALLVRAGHEVTGVYMKNWINEENIIGHCPWQEDIDDARAVADQLGIEFRVVNLMMEYREKVVKYLLQGYQSGITPNPDVMCNRDIKFGTLWQWAREHAFEAIATGHYARKVETGAQTSILPCPSEVSALPDALADVTAAIQKDTVMEWHDPAPTDSSTASPGRILRGADPNKDQTYFLAMMRPEQVAIARFPIGHLLKPQLREIAHEMKLKTAAKPDSQGICFIGEVKMEDFLRTFVPDRPGPIVDLGGRVLGEHRGLHLYTLGQRRGIGVPSNLYKEAYVVVAKHHERNELVIAIERPDTPLLWAQRCTLNTISHTNKPLTEERMLQAQPRYRAPAAAARFVPTGDGCGTLTFTTPQRALTPGQICALYDDDQLIGGAIFERIDYDS